MLTPYTLENGEQTNYGFGWGVGTNPELGFLYTHSGGQAGTSTDFVMYRDKGVAVAAFSNLDRTSAVAQVSRNLARMAMGVPLLKDE